MVTCSSIPVVAGSPEIKGRDIIQQSKFTHIRYVQLRVRDRSCPNSSSIHLCLAKIKKRPARRAPMSSLIELEIKAYENCSSIFSRQTEELGTTGSGSGRSLLRKDLRPKTIVGCDR